MVGAPRTSWPTQPPGAWHLFYNLSAPAMEDALYDSVAVQRFVGHRWPDGEHGLRVTGDRAPVVLATFEDAADDRC